MNIATVIRLRSTSGTAAIARHRSPGRLPVRPFAAARRFGLVALLVASAPAVALAQAMPRDDLFSFSLEELMNIRVTTAERKEQAVEDVAGAIYVITQDAIRRSGITQLPEIFRLVPGMQVARVNATEWAVGVRGFNSLYSDKLLVLIDGRSLYNRGFSGVFWDGQQIMLSDIERIEVIRGPGGTAWGANAVNGVINIITKSAADTEGTAVEVSTGTFERDSASVRYGGAVGDIAYRLYSRWADQASGLTSEHTPANDGWKALTTGFRADWSRGANTIMAQASYMTGDSRPQWIELNSFSAPPSIDGVSALSEMVALGRWTHRRSSGSLFQIQAFRTVTRRDEVTLDARERTTDVDAQFQKKLGGRHEIVAGGGYRRSGLSTVGSFTLDIPSDEATVLNGFVQDDITLGRGVTLTAGSKLEHDTFAGWGVLPSARVMWNMEPAHHRVWAAVSRARRTPSAAYRAMKIYGAAVPGENGIPLVFALHGNPEYRSEELLNVEAGYRYHLGATLSVDFAAFRGRYAHGTTIEPQAPRFELTPSPHVLLAVQYDNLLNADVEGLEMAVRWAPLPNWRLDGSYSTVHLTPDVDESSQDPTARQFDGNAPRHQWQIHSTTDVFRRVQIDGGLYYVGRLQQLDVPAYMRADARLEVKLTKHLSAAAVGQNLLQDAHEEFSVENMGLIGTFVPRSARVQLRWQF